MKEKDFIFLISRDKNQYKNQYLNKWLTGKCDFENSISCYVSLFLVE